MSGRQPYVAAMRAERNWNWTFWMAILAFEAVGLLLSAHT